jgi:hypothetical protein
VVLYILSPAIVALAIVLFCLAAALLPLGYIIYYVIFVISISIRSLFQSCGIHREHLVSPVVSVVACWREFVAWWHRERIAREREEADRRWHRDQAELSRRRDEVEARAQKMFDDLERGIPLPSHETQDNSPIIATISLDEPPPRLTTLTEISCLPLIKAAHRTYGLLLQRSQDPDDHYARLGTFELDSNQLNKLPQSPGVETFLLV